MIMMLRSFSSFTTERANRFQQGEWFYMIHFVILHQHMFSWLFFQKCLDITCIVYARTLPGDTQEFEDT
jgi:hypothetical protein